MKPGCEGFPGLKFEDLYFVVSLCGGLKGIDFMCLCVSLLIILFLLLSFFFWGGGVKLSLICSPLDIYP